MFTITGEKIGLGRVRSRARLHLACAPDAPGRAVGALLGLRYDF